MRVLAFVDKLLIGTKTARNWDKNCTSVLFSVQYIPNWDMNCTGFQEHEKGQMLREIKLASGHGIQYAVPEEK